MDGGNTWEETGDFRTAFLNILEIYFVNADTEWIYGVYYDTLRLKTVDGGEHWSSYTYDAHMDWPAVMTDEAAFFVSSGVGWRVGYEIVFVKPGQQWKVQAAGFDLSAVDFVDSKHGWSVGKNGTILHTSTGGEPVP